jgi:hypothetical protein
MEEMTIKDTKKDRMTTKMIMTLITIEKLTEVLIEEPREVDTEAEETINKEEEVTVVKEEEVSVDKEEEAMEVIATHTIEEVEAKLKEAHIGVKMKEVNIEVVVGVEVASKIETMITTVTTIDPKQKLNYNLINKKIETQIMKNIEEKNHKISKTRINKEIGNILMKMTNKQIKRKEVHLLRRKHTKGKMIIQKITIMTKKKTTIKTKVLTKNTMILMKMNLNGMRKTMN